MSRLAEERNQDATVYIGNLDERCTEALIWELMLQAGPVGKHSFFFLITVVFIYFNLYLSLLLVNVHLPKDRVTQTHQGYGFCEYMSEDDADYAIKIMNQIKLYGKPIRVNKVRKIQIIVYYLLILLRSINNIYLCICLPIYVYIGDIRQKEFRCWCFIVHREPGSRCR